MIKETLQTIAQDHEQSTFLYACGPNQANFEFYAEHNIWPFLLTNMSGRWIEFYMGNQLYLADYAFHHTMDLGNLNYTQWHIDGDITQIPSEYRPIRQMAIEAGLEFGISFGINDHNTQIRAIFSFGVRSLTEYERTKSRFSSLFSKCISFHKYNCQSHLDTLVEPYLSALTARQLDILKLVKKQGYGPKQLSQQLGIGYRTVQNELYTLRKIFSVDTTTQLASISHRWQL